MDNENKTSEFSDIVTDIIKTIREKYDYTDEQFTAYFQGQIDCSIRNLAWLSKKSETLLLTQMELERAKALLKSAIDEWNYDCEYGNCKNCIHWENEQCKQEWSKKAEALKLIGECDGKI